MAVSCSFHFNVYLKTSKHKRLEEPVAKVAARYPKMTWFLLTRNQRNNPKQSETIMHFNALAPFTLELHSTEQLRCPSDSEIMLNLTKLATVTRLECPLEQVGIKPPEPLKSSKIYNVHIQ
jgi:hypothetical protein